MAKKKKKTGSKKAAKQLAIGSCSGVCVYSDGVFFDSLCDGDCVKCPGQPVSSTRSLPGDPPVIELVECVPKTPSKARVNHKVHQLICDRLPNGDVIYACRISFSKAPVRRKAKKKTKK